MVPINGDPFLHYLISILSRAHINQLILSVGYKKEKVIDFFNNQYLDCNMNYAIEDSPLGTGGAVVNSLEYIHGDYFWLINGDTFFPIDFLYQQDAHFMKSADISIAVKKVEDTSRYGSLRINDENVITEFVEKEKSGSGFINGGVYLVKKSLFSGFEKNLKFSFEDFLNKKVKEIKVLGVASEEEFIDIGTPEDYNKFENLILKGG